MIDFIILFSLGPIPDIMTQGAKSPNFPTKNHRLTGTTAKTTITVLGTHPAFMLDMTEPSLISHSNVVAHTISENTG